MKEIHLCIAMSNPPVLSQGLGSLSLQLADQNRSAAGEAFLICSSQYRTGLDEQSKRVHPLVDEQQANTRFKRVINVVNIKDSSPLPQCLSAVLAGLYQLRPLMCLPFQTCHVMNEANPIGVLS